MTNLSSSCRLVRAAAIFALSLILLMQNAFQAGASRTQESGAQEVERGKFRIYKLQYPVGEERYEIKREGDALSMQSKFEITYLGDKVPLTAQLRTRADLTPERFEIKGRTSTRSEIDTTIEIRADAATIREGTQNRTIKLGERAFPTGGLLPVTMQMMLFRYGTQHRLKSNLKTLPDGRASFEYRGKDRVNVSGKELELERYSVSGLMWGRETVWFDAGGQLIAVVSPDAELDRLEAVREGYEAALPLFVAQVAKDAVVDLERISNSIKPLHRGRFAITGALLIDGTGRPPLKDSVILIENERIVAVGPRSEVRIPKNTRTFDARGQSVLPGLWDMHAHVSQSEWIPACLAAGVTTMRDAGNEPEFILPIRQAIREGRVTGPRLLLAGIIDSPPNALGNNIAETPEQARALVRRYHQLGYEQIKIYQSLKPELVAVVTAEAHRLGMTVTGHVPTGMDAMQAVEAGMDEINHINFLLRLMRGRNWKPQPGVAPPPVNLESPEAQSVIKFFKERGTIVDPTLARGELNLHSLQTPFVTYEPSMPKVPHALSTILNQTGVQPDVAQRFAPTLALGGKLAVALKRAGVPVVAGTDLVVPGHTQYRELELYVRSGMTPMEAIQSATIVPARAMKLDKELGTIEKGKIADLIIVNGNPLENISEIRNTKFVITRGRLFDTAPFWRSVDFQP